MCYELNSKLCGLEFKSTDRTLGELSMRITAGYRQVHTTSLVWRPNGAPKRLVYDPSAPLEITDREIPLMFLGL